MNYEQVNDINPKEIITYLKQNGWKYIDEVPPSIELYKNEKYSNRQLQIPVKSDLNDYSELVGRLAEKLSKIESRTIEQIINDWRTTNFDTIRMRLNTKNEYSVSFTRALQTMESARKALIASACTIISPQKHHAKLRRVEANELMDACKMEQTEKGSFIIKISCPVNAVNLEIPGSNEIPFARLAVSCFMKSLKDVKELARNEDESVLIPESLSSNFCNAIHNMLEDDIEFSASWAMQLPMKDNNIPSAVYLTSDLAQKIGKIEALLRPVPPSKNQIIFGSVENLDGQMGDDNKRSGDVTIKFIHDDDILYAKASLNSEQYIIADQAHMNGKTVFVKGLLKRGHRNNRIENVKEFDLAEK